MVEPGVEGFDAISWNGKRYSIKSCTGVVTGIFPCLNDKGSHVIKQQSFDYVVVCKFNHDLELEAIHELDWDAFLKHKRWAKSLGTRNLPYTKKMLRDAKEIYKR